MKDALKNYSRMKKDKKKTWPQIIQTPDGNSYKALEGMARFYGKQMEEITDPEPDIIIQRQQSGNERIVQWDSIKKVLRHLKKDKSPGITGIPMNYYKAGNTPMAKSLEDWLRIYEDHKYIPKILKLDIKTPLAKYGDTATKQEKGKATNYRPIALQCSCYKIFDGLIKNRLQDLDSIHQHIEENQGGFKKKEGTTENLFVIQEIFDRNPKLTTAFLDLSKAYDMVWRPTLIKKLRNTYGVPENVLELLNTMYSDTRSMIRIEGKIGEPFPTKRGVLQGALTSPLLFNLYINDLIRDLNKQGIGPKIGGKQINNLFFADDICLISKTPQ